MNRREFLALPLMSVAGGAPDHPNVVIFLADDLGWADVGFHGSETRTPNIDRLAREGVEMERFYSYPVCSPTRSGRSGAQARCPSSTRTTCCGGGLRPAWSGRSRSQRS